MKTVDITIRGTTPLMCNRFTDEAAAIASGGTRPANSAGNRGTPREQAAPKRYLDEDGIECIPQPNIMRCLVDGGKFHKAGKKQITTKAESMLYSCMDVKGTMLPIRSKEEWRVDTRPVRIPATGGRILAHRPLYDEWELDFELEIDDDFIAIPLIRQIVDDAGKRIGLGDFRPSTKGPFGKFVVTKWKEQVIQ